MQRRVARGVCVLARHGRQGGGACDDARRPCQHCLVTLASADDADDDGGLTPRLKDNSSTASCSLVHRSTQDEAQQMLRPRDMRAVGRDTAG